MNGYDLNIAPQYREHLAARLKEVLTSWDGTPYCARSAIKGKGADCINFVAAVIDELYGQSFNVVPDGASVHGLSHQSDAFIEFYVRCRNNWPVEREKAAFLDMGDVVLERPSNGHAHVYIAGYVPGTLWHCLHGHGVCCAGIGQLQGKLAFFRLKDKHKWVR